MPVPALILSLLGVTLESSVATCSDLLPENKPLLSFLWHSMRQDKPPDIYEWQVLPFGTTCSLCSTTFALQRHISSHSTPDEDVRHSVERCFYVDNCLQSIPTSQETQHLLDKLCKLLASGGFNICQWASNIQEVISYLRPDLLS